MNPAYLIAPVKKKMCPNVRTSRRTPNFLHSQSIAHLEFLGLIIFFEKDGTEIRFLLDIDYEAMQIVVS